jgi:hypothetical protein
MLGRITRRAAMGVLGAGGLAGSLVGRGTPLLPADAPANAGDTPAPSGAFPAALHPGARFGRWSIARIHPVEHGALRVDVREANGHEFALEILARDPAPTSRPPAEVGALAFYVCNGGDGWLPTVEEQGLAAMTLAALLEKHGQTGAIPGLLTHQERVVLHADVLRA